MRVLFEPKALEEYSDWALTDKAAFRKINRFISEIRRGGVLEGTGKPEALKHRSMNSRRINEKDRFVYKILDDTLYIESCKGHYDDK
ncbi:toxin YoeB [Clostridia bacterium]|nr:toxin YoeB [Clostridia bacterium]